MALTDKLTNIADAIRSKTGKTDLLTLDAMPTEITSIQTGGGSLPEEAFTITGVCDSRFANGGWDWFIKNYGSQVTTKDITTTTKMFEGSVVETIPFEINLATTNDYMSSMFSRCSNLTSLPKINNCRPANLQLIFANCERLREIPEDFCNDWDWSYMDSSGGTRTNTFTGCFSLRSFPMEFLAHAKPTATYAQAVYRSCFSSCYALDEIVDLPIPYTATWTSNAFSSTFDNCTRLKNMTFALNDGQPYVVNWSNQEISLEKGVGWEGSGIFYCASYNSGITADKEVYENNSYQALKDDPDWFATELEYSRYNHDSAVATINSLPDASAYLATAGGTNYIRFKQGSGSATDGGAVDTLTEEEIAVAAAKGWTVVFIP